MLIMLGFYIALFQVLRTCPKRFTIIITPDRPIYPIRNLLNLPGGITSRAATKALEAQHSDNINHCLQSGTLYCRVTGDLRRRKTGITIFGYRRDSNPLPLAQKPSTLTTRLLTPVSLQLFTFEADYYNERLFGKYLTIL